MEEQKQPSIGINDIRLAVHIMNIACARGAIKAEEMETVGSLYNKLSNFVAAADAASNAANAAATQDGEENSGE